MCVCSAAGAPSVLISVLLLLSFLTVRTGVHAAQHDLSLRVLHEVHEVSTDASTPHGVCMCVCVCVCVIERASVLLWKCVTVERSPGWPA
jgi:hypothetical protein